MSVVSRFFRKRIAGRDCFCKLSVSGAEFTELRGISGGDSIKPTISVCQGTVLKSANKVALERLAEACKKLQDMYWEEVSVDPAASTNSENNAENLNVSPYSYSVCSTSTGVDRYKTAYAADNDSVVLLESSPGVDLIVSVGGGEAVSAHKMSGESFELPKKVLKALDAYAGDRLTLHGTLSWAATNGLNYATQNRANLSGGAKPTLFIEDISKEGLTPPERHDSLYHLCTDTGWDSHYNDGAGSRVQFSVQLPVELASDARALKIIGPGNVLCRAEAVLEEAFVVVGTTKKNKEVLVGKYDSETYRIVPFGTYPVPSSMRDVLTAKAESAPKYDDDRNPTKKPASAFGALSGDVLWLHPKDHFVVLVNEGLVVDTQPTTDIRSIRT